MINPIFVLFRISNLEFRIYHLIKNSSQGVVQEYYKIVILQLLRQDPAIFGMLPINCDFIGFGAVQERVHHPLRPQPPVGEADGPALAQQCDVVLREAGLLCNLDEGALKGRLRLDRAADGRPAGGIRAERRLHLRLHDSQR